MKKIKWLWIIGTTAILGGCTSTAKNEYSDAGNHATTVAKDIGRAVEADTKAVSNKLDAAISEKGRSDTQLSIKIRKAMLDDPDIQTTGLAVDIKNHKVILRGKIHSEVQNQQAKHIAADIAGSSYPVDDRLQVPEG